MVSLRNVTTPGNIAHTVRLHWVSEGSAGVRQYVYRPDAVYTPLFCMRSIRKPLLRRDESGPGEDACVFSPAFRDLHAQSEKFRWYEADVPWDNLDDEG